MTTAHEDDNLIIGYVTDTLNDKEKYSFDLHLTTCDSCQSAVADAQREHARFELNMQKDMSRYSATNTNVSFDQIAPTLEAKPNRATFSFNPFLPALVALVALLIGGALVVNLLNTPSNDEDNNAIAPTKIFDQADNQPTATPSSTAETLSFEPINLSFEEEFAPKPLVNDELIEGWVSGEPSLPSYRDSRFQTTQDFDTFTDGRASARLEPIGNGVGKRGVMYQTISLSDFEEAGGQFVADVKTADVTDQAGLTLYVLDENREILYAHDSENYTIVGTTEWDVYHVDFLISDEARFLQFGIYLHGNGTVWIDNIRFEASVRIEARKNRPPLDDSFENLTFENSPILNNDGWYLAGTNIEYAVVQDFETFTEGSASARYSATNPKNFLYSTLLQAAYPHAFRERRMRLSADIKTDVANVAHMWIRVDGFDGEILAFDNMRNGPIFGQTDWARYELVIDVPRESHLLYFGIVINDAGTVWIDNIQLEVVDDSVPLTTR